MNITLSIPEDIVRRAREYASKNHTSMNQLIREHLQELTRRTSQLKEAEDALDFLRSLPASLPKDELLTRADYAERE